MDACLYRVADWPSGAPGVVGRPFANVYIKMDCSKCTYILHSRRMATFWPQSASYYGAFPLHGTVRLSSGRFAFPLQFSTALEWAGLFTCRYNCAASTAVTSS